MDISSILSTAVSGLNASARQAQVAADNIVNLNTPGFSAASVRTTSLAVAGAPAGIVAQTTVGASGVDLAGELVSLTLAQVSYNANAQVIRVGDSLGHTLIDITA
jgi:flagellar hook-associated protein FlgK